ncbi:winged helix DNA-binding domain-containing protein [Saccharothrix syringae]|uniref:Winged helix DNA-binding domain-containing protein n=1 Tax=Saccharothrix syringae TaxID=103733 RepID=A0A5Q0H1G8_SACSY|nr:winged helix DNA-binding domain-containing protein [Saccharothrix syringae]QFZ19969.1 winged helix DNA-binding domain-containing protein [Saccharothrix syringae]
MTLAVIDDARRRVRLGVRHLLARPADSTEAVVGALVALHATDPATVFLSAWARLADPSVAEVEDALYGRRSLERLLAMRRTMFVVAAGDVPVVHTAAGRAVAERERVKLLAHLAEGVGWDEARLKQVGQEVLAALRERGEAAAAELVRDVPALAEQVLVGGGKPYEVRQNVSSRVLRTMAAEGLIRRARPRGTWLSSQFRWTAGAPWPETDPARARAELARRWLASFGPGTAADLKWWTGWTVRQTRDALAAVGAVEVALERGTGYVLPGDEDPVEAPEPWAALLPGLDPTPMGWQDRDWYLAPELRPRLFDATGNVGPTVWWDGRVVGGWAQRADGEVVWEPLVDVGADATAAIARQAARLTAWLGGVRVVPRFRNPLEKELAT